MMGVPAPLGPANGMRESVGIRAHIIVYEYLAAQFERKVTKISGTAVELCESVVVVRVCSTEALELLCMIGAFRARGVGGLGI